jgi:hypothetical protein
MDGDNYIHIDIKQGFKELEANGPQLWLTNGDFRLNFAEGHIHEINAVRDAKYAIELIINTENPEYARAVNDFLGNGYFTMYDPDGRVVSGHGSMSVGWLRQRKLASTNLEHDQQYTKERFEGSNDERMEGIISDDDTKATMMFHKETPGYMIAGQFKEMLTSAKGIVEQKLCAERVERLARGVELVGTVEDFCPEFKLLPQQARDAVAVYQDEGSYNHFIDYMRVRTLPPGSSVQFTNENVLVNGRAIEGIEPEFARALRNFITMSPPKCEHFGIIEGIRKQREYEQKYGYLRYSR